MHDLLDELIHADNPPIFVNIPPPVVHEFSINDSNIITTQG